MPEAAVPHFSRGKVLNKIRLVDPPSSLHPERKSATSEDARVRAPSFLRFHSFSPLPPSLLQSTHTPCSRTK